jgi:hypothetical protein
MSKEKQIEEMAKAMCRSCKPNGNCELDDKPCNTECIHSCRAEILYAAGYRKQSENAVELPCKVGDTLYVISQMKDKRFLPFITEYEVTSISIKKKSVVIWHEMDGYLKNFKQTDFGKTIFLTKEEAEARMKGGAE